MNIKTLLIALIIFGFLIIIHELGHFISAKLSGVKVEEFAVGMGPLLWSYRGKETLYSIRLVPMGGFCKMLGEDQTDYRQGSFNSKGKLTRIIILASGALMNFLGCVLLLAIVFMIIGVPTTTIASVEPDYPAYTAGIEIGDKIVSIDGVDVSSWDELSDLLDDSTEKTHKIQVFRDGEYLEFNVNSQFDEELNEYRIGISAGREKGVVSSIIAGIKQSLSYLKIMFISLGQLITGVVSTDALTGPIGVVSMVGESVQYGAAAVLNLAAVISINLAVFNILPIPALDGSRILFVLIEAVKGSPVKPETEGTIHMIGFVALMILAILIAYKDIIRLW